MRLKTSFRRSVSVFSILVSATLLVTACSEQAAKSTPPAETQTIAKNTAEKAPLPSPKNNRPNIVLILADDLGYGQIGATGHKIIKTPNIDSLASQGILFTSAYSGSTVCSPSRISLLTGRDGRLLHSNANTIKLREEDKTLAHGLQKSGYETALFGKFGVGTTFGKTDPMKMGFSQWSGLLHNIEAHRQYPTMIYRNNDAQFIIENVGGAEGLFAQRLFTDEALNFIDNHKKDKPFFMFLSYTAPHAELAAPESFVEPYIEKFPEKKYEGLDFKDTKPLFADYYPKPVDNPNAVTAGMISAMDSYIGEVIQKLKDEGVYENTLIVFTSDNGPHKEGGADPETLGSIHAFRGGKRDLYEGGIRMPTIASWPQKISQGQTIDTPWAFADLLPTFFDVANVPDEITEQMTFNGQSIAPVLIGDETESLNNRLLYWEFSKQLGDPNSGVIGATTQAARKGDWKAVRLSETSEIEIYNLTTDPGEQNNVATENPEIASEFIATFDKFLND